MVPFFLKIGYLKTLLPQYILCGHCDSHSIKNNNHKSEFTKYLQNCTDLLKETKDEVYIIQLDVFLSLQELFI